MSGAADASVSAEPGGEAARVARAGLILSLAGLASRVLGWLRLITIAAIFGASRELDAYFAAFRIPDAIFQLVAGGVVASVLIPLIAARSREGTSRAWQAVAGVANVLLLALGALGVAAALGAPWLVPLLAPGFSGEQLSLAVDLTRLMLIAPPCFLLGAVASSVLQSQGRFAASALAPLAYNLAIIGAALLLTAEMGVRGLAYGVAAGAIGYLLVVAVPAMIQTGYRHDPRAGLRTLGVRSALRSLAPRSLGLAGAQLIFIVNTALATTMGPGAVTVYTLAFTLLLVPLGIIAGPLAVAVFPSLARTAAAGADASFRVALVTSLRLTLWTGAFITFVAIGLREHVTRLVYGHGQLDEVALALVVATAAPLFVGIGAHSLNLVAARAFYARGDTATPVTLTLGQVGLTLVLAALLAGPLGLPGLALAVAIGSWAKALVMLAILERALPGGIGVAGIARAALGFVAAGAIAGLAGALTAGLLFGESPSTGLLHDALALAAAGGGAAMVFVLTSLVIALPEARRALQLARMVLSPVSRRLRSTSLR